MPRSVLAWLPARNEMIAKRFKEGGSLEVVELLRFNLVRAAACIGDRPSLVGYLDATIMLVTRVRAWKTICSPSGR